MPQTHKSKSDALSVYWVSFKLTPNTDGWANVVAWQEADAIRRVMDHYGESNVVAVDRVEHLVKLKFTPPHYEPPHSTRHAPSSELRNTDFVP